MMMMIIMIIMMVMVIIMMTMMMMVWMYDDDDDDDGGPSVVMHDNGVVTIPHFNSHPASNIMLMNVMMTILTKDGILFVDFIFLKYPEVALLAPKTIKYICK